MMAVSLRVGEAGYRSTATMRLRHLLCAPLALVFCVIGVARAAAPIPVKVMIVSMFGPEGDVWRAHRDLDQLTAVPGATDS